MMNVIRDAINSGATEVRLMNGTYIILPDVHQGQGGVQPPKIIDGKPVYRKMFCIIQGNKTTRDLDSLNKWKMGYPFMPNEYCIPERDMNLFIRLNGGIDEYSTRYWIDQYDY